MATSTVHGMREVEFLNGSKLTLAGPTQLKASCSWYHRAHMEERTTVFSRVDPLTTNGANFGSLKARHKIVRGFESNHKNLGNQSRFCES